MTIKGKIILDTNSYFRLAQSIHPLLKTKIGTSNSQLHITTDLEKEFKLSPRLENKFGWFIQDEYVENRSSPLCLGRKQQKQFLTDRETLIGIANDLGLKGLSLIDIGAATYASILDATLVTDDTDLITLCTTLEIKISSTINLLKFMCECQHIEIQKVKSIASYWVNMSDCPKNFKSDLEQLFQITLPK